MEKTGYYLGLDMGTNSIGWAVTDKDYRLLRAKGKDLWGVREFDEALTAVERRTHRISRRCRQRQQVRLGLLKSYFSEAIEKKDPFFFARLENSKFYFEDKEAKVQGKNCIFCDEDYQDADYYKEYPTIFHLRKELVENPKEHDVRLVYLALLNMFKHRGHFLNAGLGTEDGEQKFSELYREFVSLVEDSMELQFLEDVDSDCIEDILGNREIARTAKVEKLVQVLGIDKKEKEKTLLIKAVCGLKVDLCKLFHLDEEKTELCFSDYSYEEKSAEYEEKVGTEYFQIIAVMKRMYDRGILSGIMKGYSYLSEARVAAYEEHARDLAMLKKVMKEFCTKEEYDLMFRSEEPGSYSAYINSNITGKRIRRCEKKSTQEEMYKKISALLKKAEETKEVELIREKIKKEIFLSKQLTAANGIIPNQVHGKEMKKILKNAENYLPFLCEKDTSGLTVSERILRLFSFQIPYYVGPVTEKSQKDGGNGWVVRKEEGQVLPWNMEEKIDLKATKEKFIERLIRECSYISGEKVVPKASLVYEKYCVLNEINNLRIDGEKIDVLLKQDIFNELFLKGKKVTRKKLVDYLRTKGALTEDIQLTGVDININNSLTSYGKFYAVLGERIKEDTYNQMVEDIIFLSTVYGDDRKLLKEQIQEKYGERLNEKEIKRILGFKFKDWGRLSSEFLHLKGCDKSTGEVISLMEALWVTNYNMMELLHSDAFTFKESLEEKQRGMLRTLSDFEMEDMEDMYFSAPVKRMIWQTIQIIKELKKILGGTPEKIFVEMTRSEGEKGEKGRKHSRKQQLTEIYKNIKDESREWIKEIEKADESGKLRSKKMYLYFTQMGRCMYSGEPIELDELFNDNLYDIDHIYPRHYVKDDNINNNLVLVKKQINNKKSDTYPLSHDIRENQRVKELWKMLRMKNLITEEKYRRLTGRNPFTEEQKADFIARQLVETSQGTKGVAEIIGNLLPETTIVYAKASNVSDFRRDRNFPKSRIVNDFHHAQDAYLNIVVGNVYYTKFTQNPLNYIKKDYARDAEKFKYNLSRMFDWDVRRGEEVAWIAPGEHGLGTLEIVQKVMNKNTPLVTRMSMEGHGGIANETLYSARKAKAEGYIPLKTSDERMQDVTRYGGYSSVTTAYFFLVEHEEKKKRIRTIESVPVYLKEKIERNPEELEKYCEYQLQLKNFSIRLRKIRIQSLIKKDGYFMYLSGRTGKQLTVRNQVSLCMKMEWIMYAKQIEKYIGKGILSEDITEEKNMELYDVFVSKHKEGIFANRPNPMGDKLEKYREKFIQCTKEEQVKIIGELFNLSKLGIVSADLTLVGGSGKTGVMLIPKKLTGAKEVKLINQSVTGIYENSIDLLTI